MILMRDPVQPIINTGLQPGVPRRDCDRAVLTAWRQWQKPLKRLSSATEPTTGRKPGAIEKQISRIWIAN